MLLRTLISMHFITPYYIIHVIIYASMISYFMLMHIGSSEGITLLEFNEEEEEEQQETPQAVAPEEEEQPLDAGAESDQLVNICSFAIRRDRRWPSTQ